MTFDNLIQLVNVTRTETQGVIENLKLVGGVSDEAKAVNISLTRIATELSLANEIELFKLKAQMVPESVERPAVAPQAADGVQTDGLST